MLNKQSEVCVCVNGMKTKPFSISVRLGQGCVLSLLFIINIDKIDKDTSSSIGVTFEEVNVRRLLFADGLALLSSNKSYPQYVLDWFSDAFLDAGMKISTDKTEIMLISSFQCSFQTSRVTLRQTETFKYLGVTFSSNGRQEVYRYSHVFEKQVQ